jgi:hypothetical protein
VLVNGAPAGFVARGTAEVAVAEAAEGARVAGIVTAIAGPGTWRFERPPGSAAAARIKVLEGQAAALTPLAVVFLLRGEAGERVSFVVVPR